MLTRNRQHNHINLFSFNYLGAHVQFRYSFGRHVIWENRSAVSAQCAALRDRRTVRFSHHEEFAGNATAVTVSTRFADAPLVLQTVG